MNGYSSKLSLYDFIAMLMPGSIIVGVLMVLGTDGNLCLPEKTMFWLFFFIASYLAGIINHIVTAILFGKFRNCLWMIHYSYIKAQNKGYHLLDSVTLEEQYFKEPQFSDRCRTILLFALSLIIGVGGVFLIISWIKMYCKIALLLSIFYVLYLFFLIPIICRLCIKKDSKCRTRGEFLIDRYYQAYYFVKKKGYSNDIEIIESQVAFLQSMIIPVILVGITCCAYSSVWLKVLGINCSVCNEFIFIAILVFILILGLIILSMFYRQKKIYDRVWEDYHYLKLVNKENNKTSHE